MPKRSQTPNLAFCETVHATPISVEHLRVVGPEGLMLGGGAPGAALCGRDLAQGWDLQRPVTDETVARLTTPDDTGRGALCAACADRYRTGDPGS